MAEIVEYSYEGLTPEGQLIKGRFKGEKAVFLSEIKQKNLTLIKVKEKRRRLKKGKISWRDFHNGIEQLYYLLRSGMKIDRAVSLLSKTAHKEKVSEYWDSILRKLKEGRQLSQAIDDTSSSFRLRLPEFYVGLLSVGEEVGDVTGALENLLYHLNSRNSIINQIKTALAYPLFLLSASFLTIIIIFVAIIPNFSRLFEAEEVAQLPLVTKIVFLASDIIRGKAYLLIAGGILGSILLYGVKDHVLKGLKKAFMHLPFFNVIVLNIELANIFSSLGAMLKSGLELDKALKQANRVAELPYLKALLEETLIEVKKGKRISQIWGNSEVIPREIVSLIVVGENSARLGDVMSNLGSRFLDRFQQLIRKYLAFLEPAIIIFLGFFIGIIVISVMLAVINLSYVLG